MLKVIAKVTADEAREIEELSEHLGALKALPSSLSDEILREDEALYERYIAEVRNVVDGHRRWWWVIRQKYGLPLSYDLHIDFSTGDIYAPDTE
jgi:CXXX repeat modification system protein